MQSDELRQKFLDFFKKNKHKIISSASLIPGEIGLDQKTLFITAGMQPLVPFLLGKKHPAGKRIVNFQKCLRTSDIDEVGDDIHLTFFEMLGNWSLGDYWKEDSIKWSYEFLIKELNIPSERLAVSCFIGDKNTPKDVESAKIWESLGIKKERIIFLPAKDNWWGPVGDFGPCGPDTEIFYWKLNDISAPKKFNPNDNNWVEIWNNVFMQYIKDNNGNYVLAEQKNVDTGMGLERTLAVLNSKENVYQTDLFLPIIKEIEKLSGQKYKGNERLFRILADHIKTSVFLVSEGVVPSNVEQGYVLRRLIRRIVRYGKLLKMSDDFTSPLINRVVEIYKDAYPELKAKEILVFSIVRQEEEKFEKTLENGLKEFEKLDNISGRDAFNLYQSYGFPIEITEELAKEKGLKINIGDFKKELKKHQKLSRTASAGMFKGGLVDNKPETIKLHTAHHLLLAALQEVLSGSARSGEARENTIKQKGSNITSERLRIDFSFDKKLTDEEKKKIENIVNQKIKEKLLVIQRKMPRQEAQKIGAEMEFGVKYGNTVSVYFIEDKQGNIFSKEFCGGPHVKNTSELGKFKIIKEESLGSGIRRIKAILE